MSRPENLDYTQNRELSWLRFNHRVLEEAQDATVPLMERMKFVAIFTSNLDEFFMIRVGSLYDMAAADNTKQDIRSVEHASQAQALDFVHVDFTDFFWQCAGLTYIDDSFRRESYVSALAVALSGNIPRLIVISAVARSEAHRCYRKRKANHKSLNRHCKDVFVDVRMQCRSCISRLALRQAVRA